MGNSKSRQFVPIYHPHLPEMPRFPKIMIVAYPSLLSFGERKFRGLERSFDQKSRALYSSLSSTKNICVAWTSKFTTTTIINFYFCSSFYLLDATVRILHLLPYVILISSNISIYHYHFTDKKTELERSNNLHKVIHRVGELWLCDSIIQIVRFWDPYS